MAQPPAPKPLPVPQPESDFYWQKCKQHELWLRRCRACGRAYFYPRDLCPHCFSRDTEWVKSSGRGAVHTFAVVHRAPTPAFREAAPYIVALVDLEEGARIPTNLVGVDLGSPNLEPSPRTLHCGMPVEVVFEDVNEAISLPKFRPAG